MVSRAHRGRRVALRHFVMEGDALRRWRLVCGENIGCNRETRAGGACHRGHWQLERRHELREVACRTFAPAPKQNGTVRAHEGKDLLTIRAREGDTRCRASVCICWRECEWEEFAVDYEGLIKDDGLDQAPQSRREMHRTAVRACTEEEACDQERNHRGQQKDGRADTLHADGRMGAVFHA